MTLYSSKKYDKEYKRLPLNLQKQADQKIDLFVLYGPTYPSLRFKIYQKHKAQRFFELSFTKGYRVILQQIAGDEYMLLRIGSHDLLNRL